MSNHSTEDNIQSLFLDQIRQILPKNLSFVDEVAEILNVSRDSVYRRVRGETILSLEEVKKLSGHYKISLDALLSPSSDTISFNKRRIDLEKFTLGDWLTSFVNSLEMLRSFPDCEIIYSAKDIPPSYYFKFPQLALFKMFFWLKSYHRFPVYENSNYEPELVSQALLNKGIKLWDRYAEIPSSEIWSDETFNVTIRQVEFYFENGFIALPQAHALLDEYVLMINDIRLSAAAGVKRDGSGLFKLYRNEFLISDTTLLFKMGGKRMAFITYSTMNTLNTSQDSFCQETEDYLNNIINKSTLISTTGERERNKFFNVIEQRIQQSRARMHS
ncbi:MAG: helix-turn-helix domain-containing protein [Cyclobacteriaceae bacterium]|nr:helix-turn-helix domain-containing protein [Cyclobacteriaceae bacterium]MDH4295945.1 helix-turn-helix domain-containing protein [Cyclobacteriaceae bacterium]MDH5251364.1 helix-turn-helix domain-containing protein [Cyclobacteriaceae bacterium]